jgi:hypothetical protein
MHDPGNLDAASGQGRCPRNSLASYLDAQSCSILTILLRIPSALKPPQQ